MKRTTKIMLEKSYFYVQLQLWAICKVLFVSVYFVMMFYLIYHVLSHVGLSVYKMYI